MLYLHLLISSTSSVSMAESKESQIHLNDAYYGPAIPPKKSSHRPRRGRGCGCCCFLNFLWKLIVALVVILGIAILVIWLVLRPANLKFHVVNASLKEFNLTNNLISNEVHYNLTLNMTARNPNKKIGMYYDQIEAGAYYKGHRFGITLLPRFYQDHKNTTMLNSAFQGHSLILLEESEDVEFNREKNNGVFEIDVKLHLRIRMRIGNFITGDIRPKVKCELKLPLTPSGRSTGAFGTKKCNLHYF